MRLVRSGIEPVFAICDGLFFRFSLWPGWCGREVGGPPSPRSSVDHRVLGHRGIVNSRYDWLTELRWRELMRPN